MTMLSAFRRTTTDVLSTVSAATGSVTHAADSLAYLAEAGSLHAKAYRDTTAAEIAENSARRQIYRVNSAKMDISRQLLELQHELDADPDLAKIFNSIDDELFSSAPSHLRVAAE